MSNRAGGTLEVHDILIFLQSGLDLPLTVSSLRVQVSAISAFTGIAWAKHPLVRQFFRGAMRLRPQRKSRFPKWDLPLVFNFLSQLGLESNSSQSVRDLTPSLGSKEPFLTFFPDRVVLVPMLGARPKVTSVFHENQEIILSTFRMEELSSPSQCGQIH